MTSAARFRAASLAPVGLARHAIKQQAKLHIEEAV